MSKLTKLAAFCLILFVMAVPAMAQEGTPPADGEAVTADSGMTIFAGTAVGVGLVLIGAGYGISRIGSCAVESMARQPEVAGAIQTAMIISAALIEGAAFFGLIVCMMKG